MDDGDVGRDDMVINVDLNLDPTSSSELEAAHNGIEDRIRRLEEVTSRARESQRLQQLQISAPETSRVMGNESEVRDGDRVDAIKRTAERGKGCKRDYSSLVAKALEMVSDVKKDADDGGSFYDCNICLEIAKEPVLTCCGHLFCWACFYRVEYVDLTAKECPVCRGDVVDSDITPIYGSSKDRHLSESGGGVSIPPRPRAHRIESIRQQRVNTPVSYVSVAEAVRRIRIGLGLTPEPRTQQEDNNTAPEQPSEQNLDGTSVISLANWRPRSMNAEIGDSQHDNANGYRLERQTVDDTTLATLANFRRVWTESGGSTHDIATTEHPRQQNLDPTTDGSLTDSQQRSMNAEIGGSQRDNAQTLDGIAAESLTNLQRLWTTAENHGSLHNSATSQQPRQQILDSVTTGSLTDSQPLWTTSEIGGSRSTRSRHLSRLMGANDMDTLSNTVAVTQTELQTQNSTSETNSAVLVQLASGTPDASAAVAPLENLESGLVVSDDLPVLHPLSSRRRSFASRVADLENELSQESQRRRMR